jgi:uncharacterized repeat protein (TIGR04076 family)
LTLYTTANIKVRKRNALRFDYFYRFMEKYMAEDEGFWLYDLKVETIVGDRNVVCRHIEGESFMVVGENLVFPKDHKVSMYALAALLPLLPAMQRELSEHDWMSTDTEITCPDPHCGGRFRITRLNRRWFSHEETTGLPDKRSTPYWQKKD